MVPPLSRDAAEGDHLLRATDGLGIVRSGKCDLHRFDGQPIGKPNFGGFTIERPGI